MLTEKFSRVEILKYSFIYFIYFGIYISILWCCYVILISQERNDNRTKESYFQNFEPLLFLRSLGDPEPEIAWFKNDVIIDDDDRNFRQEEEDDGTAVLVIMEVTSEHRGTYKCLAKNKHGKASSSCELFVEGIILFLVLLYK